MAGEENMPDMGGFLLSGHTRIIAVGETLVCRKPAPPLPGSQPDRGTGVERGTLYPGLSKIDFFPGKSRV